MSKLSLTYKGVAVMALGAFLQFAQVSVIPSQDELSTFVKVLFVIVGAITAIYGRYRAGGLKWFGGRK